MLILYLVCDYHEDLVHELRSSYFADSYIAYIYKHVFSWQVSMYFTKSNIPLDVLDQ